MANCPSTEVSASVVDERTDQLCIEFQDRLREGQPVDLCEFLDRVEENARAKLFHCLVDIQFDCLSEECRESRKSELLRQFPIFRDSIEQSYLASLDVHWQPPEPGDSIGRYRVTQILGEGAYGCVYEAIDEELDRRVALKAPRLAAGSRKCGTKRSFVDVFCHETRLLAGLRHPNVIVIHDIVRDIHGWPWMVLEHLETCGLTSKRWTDCDLEIFIEIAQGLEYIHKKGFVHRDLKPANIMRHASGRIVICDFGLSFHCERQSQRASKSAGTLSYMSPEQILGQSECMDGRADIWAVGVLMYEMLCGQRPFVSDDREEIGRAILSNSPRPPSQINPQVSSQLERICLKCLEKSPDDRYLSAAALLFDLKRARDGVPSTRRRLLTLIGGVAIACAVLFGLVSPWSRSQHQSGNVATTTFNPSATVTESKERQIPTSPKSPKIDSLKCTSDFEGSFYPWQTLGSSQISLSEESHAGSHSLLVANRQERFDGVAVDVLPHIEVGKYYLVTGHLCTRDSLMNMQMQLIVSDDSGQRFDTLAALKVNDDWMQVYGLIHLSKPAKHLELAFKSLERATGDFLVDTINIDEVQPLFDQQLADNHDFDDGNAGWRLLTSDTANIVADADGSESTLRVTKRTGAAAAPGQCISVSSGRFYYCSSRFKSVSEQADFRIMVRELQGNPKYRRVNAVAANPTEWSFVEGIHKSTSSQMDVWVGSDGMHVADFVVDFINVVPLRFVKRIQSLH